MTPRMTADSSLTAPQEEDTLLGAAAALPQIAQQRGRSFWRSPAPSEWLTGPAKVFPLLFRPQLLRITHAIDCWLLTEAKTL